MKGKKSSWHYRVTSSIWSNASIIGGNLCPYFWMLVWAMFMWCLIVSVVGFVLFMIVAIILDVGLFISFLNVCLVALSMSTGLLPIIAIIILRAFDIDTQIKTPVILSEYIKAKKGQYCPTIEWE